MSSDNEVLVSAQGVSKKFCRDLKKSLWYGMCDVAGELLPFGRKGAVGRNQVSSASLLTPDTCLLNPEPALRAGEFWANKDITFELRRGECLGLIGHNGAGKTTLLKMLNGLIKPDHGSFEMRGRVGALIALGAGFNPILSGRENIYVNGSILGLSQGEIDAKIDDIIKFSEIREFIDAPVQSYSSGMQVRLGFAVATALDPDVLILDEVLAVGDMGFHAKCFKRIGEMTRNCAVIFVSHDLSSVARICDRSILLGNGQVRFHGSAFDAIYQYNESVRRSANVEPSVETHKGVLGFDLKVIGDAATGPIRTEAGIDFEIKIMCGTRFGVGRVLLSIYQNGATQVAQIDLSKRLTALPEGNLTIQIQVPQLNLASGHYTFNFAMFGANNRETLVHAIHCGEFVVEDLPYLGSAYKVPSQVTVGP